MVFLAKLGLGRSGSADSHYSVGIVTETKKYRVRAMRAMQALWL